MKKDLDIYYLSRGDQYWTSFGRFLLSAVLGITISSALHQFICIIIQPYNSGIEEMRKILICTGFLTTFLSFFYLWILKIQRKKLKKEVALSLKKYPEFIHRWEELTERKEFSPILKIIIAILCITGVIGISFFISWLIYYMWIKDSLYTSELSDFVYRLSTMVPFTCYIFLILQSFMFWNSFFEIRASRKRVREIAESLEEIPYE